MARDGRDALARLLAALELEDLGDDHFRADTGRRSGRMYGGLTLTQAVVAAGRTAPARGLHSLHGHFLRPGRHGEPIDFRVTRLHDGRSFRTRQVTGFQRDEVILVAVAGFAAPGRGIGHQDPMPEAPPPEDLPDWEDVKARLGQPPARGLAMEMRVCEPMETLERAGPASWRLWVRPKGSLPDDPLLHAAFLVFVTDRNLLRVGARPHGPVYAIRSAASLDHAVWIHRPVRFDDWLLYVCQSPAASDGRALAFGALYSRDGVRVATVAQEGILRL